MIQNELNTATACKRRITLSSVYPESLGPFLIRFSRQLFAFYIRDIIILSKTEQYKIFMKYIIIVFNSIRKQHEV